MKKYYFVGGPRKGQETEFFQRLAKLGGPPAGWTILPHACKDGKALHIVETFDMEDILNHLEHFTDIYESSEIVEVVEKPV